jgi:hypothetical protein
MEKCEGQNKLEVQSKSHLRNDYQPQDRTFFVGITVTRMDRFQTAAF